METGELLADSLGEQGQSPRLVSPNLSRNRQNELSFDWPASDWVPQLLQILQMASTWQGVVYLTASSEKDEAIPEIAQATCHRTLHLVQALLKARQSSAPRLYLVTPGDRKSVV